jgi:hypothetical protein
MLNTDVIERKVIDTEKIKTPETSETTKELLKNIAEQSKISEALKAKQKEMKKRITKRKKFLEMLAKEEEGLRICPYSDSEIYA